MRSVMRSGQELTCRQPANAELRGVYPCQGVHLSAPWSQARLRSQIPAAKPAYGAKSSTSACTSQCLKTCVTPHWMLVYTIVLVHAHSMQQANSKLLRYHLANMHRVTLTPPGTKEPQQPSKPQPDHHLMQGQRSAHAVEPIIQLHKHSTTYPVLLLTLLPTLSPLLISQAQLPVKRRCCCCRCRF